MQFGSVSPLSSDHPTARTAFEHRIARAAAMPVPKTPEDLLVVLGDQADAVQPIFHDSKSFAAGDQSNDATITTMLFNVAARTATQFRGNPKNGDIRKIYHL